MLIRILPLFLLIACSTTPENNYQLSFKDKRNIIFVNGDEQKLIETKNWKGDVTVRKNKDHYFILAATLKNKSKEDIIVSQEFFKMYSGDNELKHFDYQGSIDYNTYWRDIHRKDVARLENSSSIDFAQDVLALASFSSEELDKRIKDHEERDEKIKKGKDDIASLTNEIDYLKKTAPLKHTLRPEEEKSFVLQFEGIENMDDLKLALGKYEKRVVYFTIVRKQL